MEEIGQGKNDQGPFTPRKAPVKSRDLYIRKVYRSGDKNFSQVQNDVAVVFLAHIASLMTVGRGLRPTIPNPSFECLRPPGRATGK